MYAVIQTGGKQYKVTQGDVLRIEKLAADEGASVDFNAVLLVADGDNIKIGKPQVDGAKVTALVQTQGRDKKVKIIKFKRRKHHRKQMGHRQYYTDVKIIQINKKGIEGSSQQAEPENTESVASDKVTENQNSTETT